MTEVVAAPDGSGAGVTTINHTTYSTLVRDDKDLVGLVAYALYKRDKLKFCEEFAHQHARAPLATEVAIFIQGSNLGTRVDGYRAEAELLLEAMLEYQLEDAIEQVQADAGKELTRKLAEAKSWGRSIAESLLGTVVTAIFWAALILLLYTNKVGLERMAKDIFGFEMGNARPQAVSPQVPEWPRF